MKRKIAISLFVLFFVFATGAFVSMYYIKDTTAQLSNLLNLHQIEDLRQNLVLRIQTVQTDLYSVNTPLESQLDLIVENVSNLRKSAANCTSCHHEREQMKQLERVQSLIVRYQDALSYYITASANTDRIDRLKLDAASIGNTILRETEDMSMRASKTLTGLTDKAMDKISYVESILRVTMVLSFVLAVFIAVHLTLSVSRPAQELMNATRKIADGELGYTMQTADRTEFGEIAKNFNVMSLALREGYTKLESEIAERKQTQEALAKSEQFLRTMFDSIRDPFCIIDHEYRVVKVNDAYADIKQKAIPEIIGKTCYVVFYNRKKVCEDCIVEKTFRSGDACAKERLVTLPSGVNLWQEIYTYPILDASGKITHVMDYTRDITERKRTEQALRKSQERYALAARGANDGLWDWDLETDSIYYSPRWVAMLGYAESDIHDSPDDWFRLVHEDDFKQLEAKLSAHLNGNTPHFEHEYRILHHDGTYRWVLNRGLAVFDSTGKASRIAGSQTDITERKKAEEQLLHDAFHDVLTGLPNRALFMDRLQHRLVQAIRSVHRSDSTMFAVIFIDIDRFKVINDSLGHLIGDELLIEISQRLVQCVRPGDTVARLGGDEFSILLAELKDENDIDTIAGRIQKELQVPFTISGHEIFTSASMGIAIGSLKYDEAEHILRDADIAMYHAKANGKSRYEVFIPSMHEKTLQKMQLENDLRHAVENREFVIHYQPIIDLERDRVTGFEALIRWNHPKKGMIPPLKFIPLAEETGLILPIGHWLLKETCRQLSEWQIKYPFQPPLKVSINISSKQFSNPGLVREIGEVMEESGIQPGTLAIEITESMIMENAEIAIQMLMELRTMGVHIHIDDFGTGYSSLSYINRFPVNALKIDRSFVNKMSTDVENLEIVKAIVALARSLNLDIIAEGLELNEQLLHLKELKCQYGQGFLFSTPLETGAVDNFLNSAQSSTI